jgi:peroxiredoxin family protein
VDTTKKTIIVFSGDLDKLMAAFIIANGAAAMDDEVTMFFTFWGLNALRKPDKVATRGKTLLQRGFGMMMPRGPGRTGLSQMNFGGMGARMMKRVMRQQKVSSLEELIDLAREQGVKMVACTMSMDVMGLKTEEMIDGLEYAGVATYLGEADEANVNLFI